MKGFRERVASRCSSKCPVDTPNRSLTSDCLESGSNFSTKGSLWSSFFASAFSVFETYRESPPASEKKGSHSRHNGWTSAVKKIVSGGSMRRIHERVLGPSRTGISSTTSDIWLLGVCYKISEDESGNADTGNALAEFTHDYSSRILMTYRRGFDAIGDSKYISDVGWGCMLRSSQMLVAQALLFHKLGRAWTKPFQKPMDQAYVEILHLFGDSEAAPFSIHNLIQAGKAYSLAAGSWVGPYAMCRSWESLARSKREENSLEYQSLPMAVYVVSGDEDGERGGAPVVYIEDASRHCLEFSRGQADWTPILLLVPLVLGLDKVNPRYIPSLQATFTFSQSLGIMGGKPGASTYIVGVQDDNAFYLDPHEVQSVVNIGRDDIEADTSSYHSDIVRHIPLHSIDPSLAIGFYCRDKDDFDEFCLLASKLADDSQGAPLFTVAHCHKLPKPVSHGDMLNNEDDEVQEDDSVNVMMPVNDDAEGGGAQEDEWQLL
ncbi:Cysteine protease ATG4B, putative [Ricinus communis]|uniref:Cysteine protease n=1 Tax=Ricinus communis TaxID=3988 RepID=B9STA6_RICCO|nr:Cysteine protease ATG4B, putative [Ricinus communis]|eukprot:XP_002529225.1 cysteine protease ATG4 [Ricinus communis]